MRSVRDVDAPSVQLASPAEQPISARIASANRSSVSPKGSTRPSGQRSAFAFFPCQRYRLPGHEARVTELLFAYGVTLSLFIHTLARVALRVPGTHVIVFPTPRRRGL